MTFPCTSCGLCCHHIEAVIHAVPSFPYKAREDGSCEKLVGRRCSVYEDRPTVCNIDRTAELLGLDKKEFYKQNAEVCNLFIRNAGEDEKYIVKLEDSDGNHKHRQDEKS